MADSLELISNIVIPLLGLLILLPLAVAMFFESQKEYSRKLYIFMLLSCTGILITETLQFLLGGRSGSLLIALYSAVYFIFYASLSSICFFWALYAYYWFNGVAPSRNVILYFAVGFALEIAMLALNLFTGGIYAIDPSGMYVRGKLFSAYIAFSYLYLMIAIIVMMASVLRRKGRGRNHDFSLFVLFFLFPVIGPVLQYQFPELSLRGASEAVALLMVYVTVQQRLNAKYALEKVRYQEESRKYETTLEDLLSVSPDALGFSRLNLTKNIRGEEHGSSAYVRRLFQGSSVDEMFIRLKSTIADGDEAERFSVLFDRASLLRSFAAGENRISVLYHRQVDSGETHLVKAHLGMLKNPTTGDIEAIFYSEDMDRQEKEEKVISAITNREFDYIALIHVQTKKINYQYAAKKAGMSVHLKMDDYDTVIRAAITEMQNAGEQLAEFEKFSFKRVFDTLREREEYSFTFPYIEKAGNLREKQLTYRYLDENKTEILFLRSDVTEERRQESERAEALRVALQEARHASAMKTEFLSNVSHDLRTPLNAVLGYTELAAKSETVSLARGYLAKLDQAGRIMLSLINETLNLSKIEHGAITLKLAPVSCGDVIKKVVTTVQPSMDAKHIHFVLDNRRAVMATVRVDALRLQDIFINLLSNAVKFTPENGEITLTVECLKLEKNCVHDRLTVSDNGCGISKAFLPKVFEPFTQERFAETAGVGGSGLGLSIAKKLVELMGGTIEVQSELGKGTRFIVCLDFERIDDALLQGSPEVRLHKNLQGRRVLLVDDNEMNVEIAKAVLEMRGMLVSCANDGEKACEKFAESEPGYFDVILMDIRMPVMNGHDAAKKIRRMDRGDAKNIPIVAMSADAFDDDIQASLDAGMNGHIAKPVDPEKLYAMLEALLK